MPAVRDSNLSIAVGRHRLPEAFTFVRLDYKHLIWTSLVMLRLL
jgi:hypothetical protein